jgi:hypothetical protein
VDDDKVLGELDKDILQLLGTVEIRLAGSKGLLVVIQKQSGEEHTQGTQRDRNALLGVRRGLEDEESKMIERE